MAGALGTWPASSGRSTPAPATKREPSFHGTQSGGLGNSSSCTSYLCAWPNAIWLTTGLRVASCAL
eukprot:676487-Rhodomonas_salina.1